MIQQSAFHVTNSLGEFVGIVAFDSQQNSALGAAVILWGEEAIYKELTAEELQKLPASGLSVFTGTVQKA